MDSLQRTIRVSQFEALVEDDSDPLFLVTALYHHATEEGLRHGLLSLGLTPRLIAREEGFRLDVTACVRDGPLGQELAQRVVFGAVTRKSGSASSSTRASN